MTSSTETETESTTTATPTGAPAGASAATATSPAAGATASSTPGAVTITVDRIADGDGGAYFWAIRSVSDAVDFSTAGESLPDVLHRFAPEIDQSQGILFAVPHRGLLMARDVTSGDHLYNGIGMMGPYAARAHDRYPHPVSPEVSVWLDGEVTRVTSVAAPGEGAGGSFIHIHEDGPLADLLRQGR
ncbi:hypothetical protein [Corynebacterium bovis]|uniref:hypothetical protein n=1 Tax=Corynebacterium bovis TaxID=36808 RepID=UPI001639DC07|nr:hypothetical protein [Corynebacterium bovis]MDN8579200.1 hypothetical protein [Corynebacterium bovis]